MAEFSQNIRQELREDYWYQQTSSISRDDNLQSFLFLGHSGAGKSITTRRILEMYPQVIRHREYPPNSGELFPWTQIVWLKVECPANSSTAALCKSIFKAIDEILGTNYLKRYGKGNKDEMMDAVATLAFRHSIGVLVIDEIQNLSLASSGGADVMLNFFVQLVNTIGMPVVFIGTPLAKVLMNEQFRLVRRFLGAGETRWNPMDNDWQWKLFVEAIWQYQYLEDHFELTPALQARLHELSAGIPDMAVKIFIMAQARLMILKEYGVINREVLNLDVLDATYREDFKSAHAMLAAVRDDDPEMLKKYHDLSFHNENDFQSMLGELINRPEIVLQGNSETQSNANSNSTSQEGDSNPATSPTKRYFVAINKCWQKRWAHTT